MKSVAVCRDARLAHRAAPARKRAGALCAPLFFLLLPPLFLILVTPLAFVHAAEPPLPLPLPPPPELLDDGMGGASAAFGENGDDPEETRRALEPPAAVAAIAPAAATVPNGTAAASPAGAPTTAERGATASVSQSAVPGAFPPSRYAPGEYLDAAVVEEGVPGVLLPEIDYSFFNNAFSGSGRQATPGMSVRQLEPYFALAKGSESMAMEARRKGDDALFQDQVSKSLDAYMAIIAMADAGNEAREEAWYGAARCEYRRGNWWKAFDALERSFPKRFEKAEVAGRIKLEMFIAERLWRMENEPAPDAVSAGEPMTGYQAASRVYAAVIFNQPSSSDAPVALLRRGDAAAMDKEWKEAAKFYRQVVEFYPESEQAMQARSSLAEAIYRQEWPAGLPEAARSDLGLIMDDVERADTTALSEDAQVRRGRTVELANAHEAETKLRHAKEYLKSLRVRKSRDAAVFLLGEVVSRFPGTEQASEAAGILRGMGIEPPMVLSDGSRFPITAGASGAELRGGGAAVGTGGGGNVMLEGQYDSGGPVLQPSPTRETIFRDPTRP